MPTGIEAAAEGTRGGGGRRTWTLRGRRRAAASSQPAPSLASSTAVCCSVRDEMVRQRMRSYRQRLKLAWNACTQPESARRVRCKGGNAWTPCIDNCPMNGTLPLVGGSARAVHELQGMRAHAACTLPL